MQKESLKNIKYPKRYKQFKTETKNKKTNGKTKNKFQNPFSPGLRHEPGLKGIAPFSPGSCLKPGLKISFELGLMLTLVVPVRNATGTNVYTEL